MTDDLIERLREQGRWYVDNAYNLPLRAADRIEELEAEAAENARIIGMSAEREMALRGEVERLRGLLREAEVKLTDVQGAYATKRYADNLLARIRAALEGKSNE